MINYRLQNLMIRVLLNESYKSPKIYKIFTFVTKSKKFRIGKNVKIGRFENKKSNVQTG